MQTKDLIKIELITDNETVIIQESFDYGLTPLLDKYITKHGQKGVDRIKQFTLYALDQIQKSYDYKRVSRVADK